ncbi:MAG: hypothetical protein ACPGXK_00680 [Phycisphaerae bacterium]
MAELVGPIEHEVGGNLEHAMQDIEFATTTDLAPDELRAFYERHGIHTTASEEQLRQMLEHTFCFVTARRHGELIGLARGVTDGLWGRLAECKLDPRFQGPACLSKTGGRIEHDATGIAREMAQRVIDALRNYGVERIDAVAYGTEVDFCQELGFRRMSGVVALEWQAS